MVIVAGVGGEGRRKAKFPPLEGRDGMRTNSGRMAVWRISLLHGSSGFIMH